MKIELENIIDEIGSLKTTSYNSKFNIATLFTDKGFQLLFDIISQKIISHNLTSNRLLLSNTLNNNNILWLCGHSVVVSTEKQFAEFIANKGNGIGYNLYSPKLNKNFFNGNEFIAKYLPLKNWIIILGMAENSVGEGQITHWDSRSYLTVWNLANGELVFEFQPYYSFGDFYRIEVSEDEIYFSISQVYEWDDLYIFNLAEKQLIKAFSLDNNSFETHRNEKSGRLCFFHNEELFLLPHYSYDGLNGEFRVFNLKSKTITHIVINEKQIEKLKFSVDDFTIDKDRNLIFFVIEGRIRCFDYTDLTKNKKLTEQKITFETSIPKIQCVSVDTMVSRLVCLTNDNEIVITEYNTIRKIQLNIQTLNGHWMEGFALDLHTTSSTPIGVTEQGRTLFDTKYTEIGEHLYQLKYRSDKSRIKIIAQEAANFIKSKKNWQLHKLIPIPPSDTTRSFQLVYELAKAIGIICKLEVDFSTLKKLKSTSQLKSIDDPEQRREILKDAFDITLNTLAGKNVLLFDDLFRSGESLNAVCDIVKNKGKAANVYVLTITKTRSKK
jgi:predicted amidophosphoribosyltransferase